MKKLEIFYAGGRELFWRKSRGSVAALQPAGFECVAGYFGWKTLATFAAISPPMASDAVAAGLGALRT